MLNLSGKTNHNGCMQLQAKNHVLRLLMTAACRKGEQTEEINKSRLLLKYINKSSAQNFLPSGTVATAHEWYPTDESAILQAMADRFELSCCFISRGLVRPDKGRNSVSQTKQVEGQNQNSPVWSVGCFLYSKQKEPSLIHWCKEERNSRRTFRPMLVKNTREKLHINLNKESDWFYAFRWCLFVRSSPWKKQQKLAKLLSRGLSTFTVSRQRWETICFWCVCVCVGICVTVFPCVVLLTLAPGKTRSFEPARTEELKWDLKSNQTRCKSFCGLRRRQWFWFVMYMMFERRVLCVLRVLRTFSLKCPWNMIIHNLHPFVKNSCVTEQKFRAKWCTLLCSAASRQPGASWICCWTVT